MRTNHELTTPKTVGATAGNVSASDYSKTRTSVEFQMIAPQASTKVWQAAHNWGAVPPNLPLSDWQILDTSGIVGSRDHTRLCIHSMISNRTGQNSGGGLKHPLYATPENISHSYHQKSARAALFPLNTVCINGLLKGKREKKSQHFVQHYKCNTR